MENKFRFFAPVDIFEKGSDPNGNEVYRVRGIISDSSIDTDGESLSEDGLDFSDFNWINWDHKKEPKYLIGEPVGVKHIPGKGHFMEGVLYGDSPVARQAVDLMKILSKSNRKNKLSWSVEGRVLERDLLDPKKVKKAKVTAVALCPSPKNGNTWAELIQKGFSDECYQNPEDLEYDVNGGEVKLIDEIEGEVVSVDKDGNISIDKAQTTQNSAALIPESVEGNDKKLEKSLFVIVKAHKEGLLEDEFVLKKAIKLKKLLEIDNYK